MPSLVVPESGLSLASSGESSKSASAVPPVFGLTLSDGVIENMIKCFRENKLIQLSLGESPKITYASKTQHLSTSPDPFTHELYRSTNPSSTESADAMKHTRVEQKFNPRFHAMFAPKHLKPKPRAAAPTQPPAPTAKTITSTNAGGDSALADLQRAMSAENAKKAGNTTKYIKDGTLAPPGRRGGPGKTTKSKFLPQNRSLASDTTRSMPSSPALSSVGSPSLGPNSVPLSQQQAEQAKATRRPIIHLLALGPMTEIAIREKVEGSKNDIKMALEKVGDLNQGSGKWELRKNYWKELDVWSYKYTSSDERQRAIDNAVRQYDKMRMGIAEPEWDRLLPKEERGTGKCLSKLQAKIATGTAKPPKINVSKAEDSGRDTPAGNDEDLFEDKPVSKIKGESMSRSVSQPPTTKTKKTSEREAQAKRLLSKNPSKATATKTASAKKAKTPAEKGSQLSKQFVEDSDEEAEDYSVQSKSAPKPIKRQREDEVDTSDSSNVPLSKKVKKDVKEVKEVKKENKRETPTHRISDASQSSRSTQYSSASSKNKGTSPHKSSPLASSPPTNASEFEGEFTSNGRISSSSSPYDASLSKSKRKREDVDDHPIKRQASSSISSTTSFERPVARPKSNSVSSSGSSSGSHDGGLGLPSGIVDTMKLRELARNYKSYYPKYIELHSELSALPFHDAEKEKDVRDMHERLSRMKTELMDGLRAAGLNVVKTPGADWRPVTHGGTIDYRAYF